MTLKTCKATKISQRGDGIFRRTFLILLGNVENAREKNGNSSVWVKVVCPTILALSHEGQKPSSTKIPIPSSEQFLWQSA